MIWISLSDVLAGSGIVDCPVVGRENESNGLVVNRGGEVAVSIVSERGRKHPIALDSGLNSLVAWECTLSASCARAAHVGVEIPDIIPGVG